MKCAKPKILCRAELPYEENLFLSFPQYYKSIKTYAPIYSDTESLIKKVDKCRNDPKDNPQ